jgi:hypothetical protein
MVSRPTPDFPALEQFFGAYFHPDWDEVYDLPPGQVTEQTVITDFVEHSTYLQIMAVLDEAKQLLSQGRSEDELRADLLAHLLGYHPWYDGRTTAHNWLLAIIDMIETTAETEPRGGD